ncbi:ATP synthase mitochondrial F1 complex assembly factor 2 isoform X2 [Zootermopsis nevadensis]|uniref:ATP synthase mitochondrial F1 complex assembly factor 2 isoform X2 n=1 Tax=Zootermopsis nevadensis TaxID=136037 RepID=UPI000B8EAA16|nr:ATP synthase mitochondrial F1 complex assembly factor 2 isoform X2 [Zootermopsis nevadensis]
MESVSRNVWAWYMHEACLPYHIASPKRFYRKTGILRGDGKFEITLDQRKLKSPKGSPFVIESEPLALAVAAEWDAQKGKIQQSSMHLSGLCSTAIDNPNKLTKSDLVQHIIGCLDTDTVLYQSSEADELYEQQIQEWDPVLKWFCKRYGVKLEAARDISGPIIDQETKNVLTKHLLSYNFWAIHGFSFGVEALKSVILTLCCVERYISIEKAVLLSRLEEEFQSGYWGRVEWAHDLNQQETQARLAAAVLFIHLNSSSTFVQSKKRFATT